MMLIDTIKRLFNHAKKPAARLTAAYVLNEIKLVKKALRIIAKLAVSFEKSGYRPFRNKYEGSTGVIQVEFTDLSELPKLAAVVKQVYPGFRYTAGAAWNPYNDIALLDYMDLSFPFVQLRFKTTIDKWPEELKKDSNCSWVPQVITETRNSLVCKV